MSDSSEDSIPLVEDDPLEFNGSKLVAKDAKGKTIGSWDAESGKTGSTTQDQGIKDYGPIPEGNKYSVDSSKIQKWSNLPWYQKIAAMFGAGQWPGGPAVWGYARVPIDISGGNVLNRGNFFIHGGLGSQTGGCIKILGKTSSFFNYLSNQKGPVPLTVNYGK